MPKDDFEFDFEEDFLTNDGADDPVPIEKDDQEGSTGKISNKSAVLHNFQSQSLTNTKNQPSNSTDGEFVIIEDQQDDNIGGNSLNEEVSENKSANSTISSFNDDDDDELFSKINEMFEKTIDQQNLSKSPTTTINTTNPEPNVSTSKPLTKERVESPIEMASPVTSQGQLSGGLSHLSSLSLLQEETSKKVSSNAISVSSRSSVVVNTGRSSREAFFANWETDELSIYEKRLNTMKRRFPGPAGLLPRMTEKQIKLLDDSSHPFSQQISKIISESNNEFLSGRKSSHSTGNSNVMPISSPELDRHILRISKAPWRELIKIMQLNPNDPDGLLKMMNLRWVRKISKNHPVTTKIPFLAFVVQEEPEILCSKRQPKGERKNPSIKLMDPSGSIVGAMDAKFVEMYGTELSPGTAIAVKHSGFLRFRRHVILTITQKNIICLISLKNDKALSAEKQFKVLPSVKRRLESSSENCPVITESAESVRIIRFGEFCPVKAKEEYRQIMNTNLENGENCNSASKSSNLAPPISKYNGSSTPRPSTCNSNVNMGQKQTIATGTAAPPRNIVTAPPNLSSVEFEDSSSAFWDDDDDDELMMALDNVDLLMEMEKANNNNNGSS